MIEGNERRITEIFMPKDNWIKDEQVKICTDCRGTFDLLNRKHHCRMCGNIFHSKCSNNFVSPPYFYYENEDKIRLCNKCFEHSQEYLRRGTITERGLSLTAWLDTDKVIQLEKGIQANLNKIFHEHSSTVMNFIFRQNDIPLDWMEILKNIARETIEIVHPDFALSETLDINKFIKIKKILYPDRSLTRFVRGTVIRKNISLKGMQTTLEKPRLLMIQGGIDVKLDSDTPILEQFNKERDQLDLILKKIIKVKPNLIITDGNVKIELLEELTKNEICVCTKLRPKQFANIQELARAIAIDDIATIPEIDEKFLGSFDYFRIINYDNLSCYEDVKESKPDENWEKFDPTLMVIDGCDSEKGICIVISGPNYQELVKLKRAMKEIFQIMRIMMLERTVISQDIYLHFPKETLWKIYQAKLADSKDLQDFRENLKIENFIKSLKEVLPTTCLVNEATFATTGIFLQFITEKYKVEKLLKKIYNEYGHITLVPLDISSIPDLASNEIKAIMQKLTSNLTASNRIYKDEVCQLEADPKIERIYSNDKDDISLGHLLFREYSNMMQRCVECYRFYYHHVNMYFVKKFYVKIYFELDAGDKLEHIKRESKKMSSKPRKDSTKDKEGFFEFLAGFNPSSPNALNKASLQNQEVFMYLECDVCKMKISDSIRLRKEFLDYPFSRFIECLLYSAETNIDYFLRKEPRKGEIKESSTQIHYDSLPKRPNVKTCCLMTPKVRVFKINELSVKFRLGYFHSFSLNFLNFKDEKAVNFSKKVWKYMVDTKKSKLLELQKNYIDLIISNLKDVMKYLAEKCNLKIADFSAINTNDIDHTDDPYHQLLLELVPFLSTMETIKQDCKKNSEEKVENHLEIDILQREFFEKIANLADVLDKKKQEYIEFIEESKMQMSMTMTENGDMMNESMSKKNISIANKARLKALQVSIKKSPSNDKVIEKDKETISKEIEYVDQLIAGWSMYSDSENETKLYKNIPVYPDQPLTAIAYALNSNTYLGKLYYPGGFSLTIEVGNTEYNLILKEKMLGLSDDKLPKSITVNLPATEILVRYFNKVLLSIPDKEGELLSPNRAKRTLNIDVIEDITGIIDIGGNSDSKQQYTQKISTPEYSITIYYPAQFESLRIKLGCQLKDFIDSLSVSISWENSGGKTGASFIKTYDQRFVFKQVDKKEFTMLNSFASKYFEYMWEVTENKKPSLLAKIYGIFEIGYEKNSPTYYIAMENLFYMTSQKINVYDLKGSEANRFIKEPKGTLLDTNFKLDRNGEPVPMKAEQYDFMEKAINNDTEFLSSVDVVDYSLLLILDEDKRYARMGIIDYLRQYDLQKMLEHHGKKFIKGVTPTITNSKSYKDRFKKAMKRYFMSVPNEY